MECHGHQPGDPGHAICSHGYLKGGNACDTALLDDWDSLGGHYETLKGSGYNFEFLFFVWARDAANDSLEDRRIAHSMIQDYVQNRFNQVTNQQVQTWTSWNPAAEQDLDNAGGQ